MKTLEQYLFSNDMLALIKEISIHKYVPFDEPKYLFTIIDIEWRPIEGTLIERQLIGSTIVFVWSQYLYWSEDQYNK